MLLTLSGETMSTTAIIAEFNPLHSGHQYIIEQARSLTNADCVVVVLSGSFTQRGDIAIAPKYVRAQAAIACGADVVIELPFAYATASAEFFASGAVTLLDSLGSIDYLVFGAECDDIAMLSTAADILLEEPPAFKQTLTSCLSSGMSFPAARARAFIDCGGTDGIFTPNNTLGIEYIKALKRLSSRMVPVAVSRMGSGYNDTEYSAGKGFISASAFRAAVADMASDDRLYSFLDTTLPRPSRDALMSEYNKSFPVFNDDMSSLVRYALLTNRSRLESFCDFTPALANRVHRLLDKEGNAVFSGTYEDFILKLKTRDITAARIKRAMLHLLTGFTVDAGRLSTDYLKSGRLPYARLLAISPAGRSYIAAIKKGCDTILINSLGRSMPLLDENASSLIHFDILASDIYASVAADKFHHTMPDEYRAGVRRLNHFPA